MPDKVIWRIYDYGFSNSYYAERVINKRAVDYKELSAHCLACAKTELMAETGEYADIRGWHTQGMCGSFLKAMHVSLLVGDYEDE